MTFTTSFFMDPEAPQKAPSEVLPRASDKIVGINGAICVALRERVTLALQRGTPEEINAARIILETALSQHEISKREYEVIAAPLYM